jgi:hypothetical protein
MLFTLCNIYFPFKVGFLIRLEIPSLNLVIPYSIILLIFICMCTQNYKLIITSFPEVNMMIYYLNNELLMDNHHPRPTGLVAFPEEITTTK